MPKPAVPAAAPIVVADTATSFQALHRCLSDSFDLVHAADSAQARALVQPLTPAVLCGAHFDDGRMYDLLRWAKSTAAVARVPFVVTRVSAGELDDAIYESVKVASAALGGNGFIDLFRWRLHHGEEEAARRLAERVRALVD
jgi:hypothetical protein